MNTVTRASALRFGFALLIPVVACALQLAFWAFLQPLILILFYPAVFLSSRVSGLVGGLAATALSSLLVVYVFIEPRWSFAVARPDSLYSVAVFIGMGVLFSATHQQLREAQRRITDLYQRTRQLDELKSQLFANVSHELRTPLTLILGPVRRWLADKPLDAADRRDLEVVERNAALLYRHITDLLDVSRVESGRMPAQYSREDVSGLVRFVASHFDVAAAERGIRFDVDAPGAVTAEIDVDMCRRIVLNLLSNAFKFTPDRGTIRISVADQGGDVAIEVHDSGPGIPADMREAVFERFRQLDGGATRKVGGTGLGLAIVREFTRLQHGDVTVGDAALGGAAFRVRLPRAAPSGVDVLPPRATRAAELDIAGSIEARGSSRPQPSVAMPEADAPRVLVVEDNPDMRAYVVALLARRYRVREAGDGKAGLEAAETETPDLIVSDLMMPRMSGDEMVAALRERPALADVPVIILTAKSDDAARVDLFRLGVHDYVDKPFSDATLLARVESLLTESRRTEERIKGSENRYRKFFENSMNGMAYCRMLYDGDRPEDWIYLAVNEAFSERTGLRGVEGRRVSDVIPGIRETDPQLFEIYGRVAKTGRPEQFEREVAALQQWFAVSAYSPAPDHFVAIFDVVTERYRTEKQLREISQAVQQSPAAIVITDPSGAITYVNQRFTDTTGYTFDEVKGQNPRLLKSGETPAEHYRVLWETITAGREWQGEFCNRRKSGELFWERASISPVVDPSGRITSFLAVKEDITERRRLEEQLRHAQRLDAIGHLAGGVAHDFNNILAASMMHIGLLRMHPALDPDIRSGLDEIESETKRAADLTRQLLMFSRRSVLNLQPTAINDVVEGLLKMLRRLIGEDLELQFERAPGLPPVNADPGMLEQVLVNLVINARDAMPKGGRVVIRTGAVMLTPADARRHPEAHAGQHVFVLVEDTGCGMDDATLAQAFEPFFTTKEPGKGTGLGLATAHGIVSQHGGWIGAESHLGRGSRFTVYLPVSESQAVVASMVTPPETPRGRGERVLLVEDEAELRSSVARMLTSLGYTVFVAGSGRDALRSWTSVGGDIDLVLTDVVMPEGLSGLELVERLRVLKPGLRVIVSSGYSPELARDANAANPAARFLPKPYDLTRLAVAVRECLDAPAGA